MGFLDALKENLGFDKAEPKAAGRAPEAPQEAAEASAGEAVQGPGPDASADAGAAAVNADTVPYPDHIYQGQSASAALADLPWPRSGLSQDDWAPPLDGACYLVVLHGYDCGVRRLCGLVTESVGCLDAAF